MGRKSAALVFEGTLRNDLCFLIHDQYKTEEEKTAAKKRLMNGFWDLDRKLQYAFQGYIMRCGTSDEKTELGGIIEAREGKQLIHPQM